VTLRVFGLTGGIGSGKSTVARRFRARGLAVVDADELAREAVAQHSDGFTSLVATFGNGIVAANGELDRKQLARIVFADDKLRTRLNEIVHPRVRELAQRRFSELDRQGAALACYEVPLLFEGGLADVLRPVVVVTAPEGAQVTRAAQRDGVSAADVQARIRAQMPLREKVEGADYVIDNDGGIPALLRRADDVLDAICAQLAMDVLPKPP
jgi:dephospho-CoA kinase